MERDKRIIKEYLSVRNETAFLNCYSYLKKQNSIEDLICNVAMAKKSDGGIQYHQRRIKKEAMKIFCNALLDKKNIIKNINDFDKLFNIIKSIGNSVSGIGEMFIYDAAFRIGHYLSIYPEKIYLHAGARIGAEGLLNKKIKLDFILKEELPEPYKSAPLKCFQLEDLFCVYRDILSNKVLYDGRNKRL